MIAEDLRRYGEDTVADWVLVCSDDELTRTCSVGHWIYLSGTNLASATALAAVYVREGHPRELVRKRRKHSTTAEGPLLENGRRCSRAGRDRASAYYPFYGVDDDAIEYWRPAAEHDDWKQKRRQAIARGKAQGYGYPDEPDAE